MSNRLRLLGAGVLVSFAALSIDHALANDVFYRNGHKCQRASSGYIVCRAPGDRYSNGYVVGRGRPGGPSSSAVFYRRNGHVCQRASSGAIVCRDPRDRWSNGYVLERD